MASAIPTTETKTVVPQDKELIVHHSQRYYPKLGLRVLELLPLVTVRYPAGIIIELTKVFYNNTPRWTDVNGWMFGEDVVDRLISERKLYDLNSD